MLQTYDRCYHFVLFSQKCGRFHRGSKTGVTNKTSWTGKDLIRKTLSFISAIGCA